MSRTKRRARQDPESSRSQSQLHSKRRRERKPRAAQGQEAADDTTAQDDVRYMSTQPKTQQPANASGTKYFPSQKTEVIDLTMSDDIEEIFPPYDSRSKAVQDQAEERSHSKYALGSETTGKSHEQTLHQSWDKQSIEVNVPVKKEGEERWTQPQEPPVSGDHLAMRQQRRIVSRNMRKEAKRDEARMAEPVENASSPAPAIMFTIPEAIAALARSQPTKTVAYDVPTGDHLKYPVDRSYHLGAMGRYQNTDLATHTSLPYRPSGAAKSSPRLDNLESDYTKVHTRFT